MELRQRVCLYIHVVVLQRGLSSLDGKLDHFDTKQMEKVVCQTQVRQTIHKVIGSGEMQSLNRADTERRRLTGKWVDDF